MRTKSAKKRMSARPTRPVRKKTPRVATSRRRPLTRRAPAPAPAPIAAAVPAAGPVAPVEIPPKAQPTPAPQSNRAGAAALVIVGAIAVGAWALTRQPSSDMSADVRGGSAREEPAEAGALAASVAPMRAPATGHAAEAAVAPRAAAELPKKPPVAKVEKSPVPEAIPPAPVARDTVNNEAAATATAPLEPAAPSRASASGAAAATAQPLVTITGCLEVSVDEDQFRLTDTEGDAAPRARSWRSGFLKKRSAAVTLAELPDPATMRSYVGKRVAATGLLTSREMQVRSLRVAGPSCN